MHAAQVVVPVKIQVEYAGDPAGLSHLRRMAWLRLVWANCAALWLVVVAALVVATCACAGPRAPAPPTPPARAPSSISDQGARAVRIEVSCFGGDLFTETATVSGHYGSGVVVDQEHVLTAHHVAFCHPGEVAQIIRIIDANGAYRRAWIDREDPEHDLARLRVDVPFYGVQPPPIAPPPHVGDDVCLSVAHPFRVRTCGVVDDVAPQQLVGNSGRSTVTIDVRHTALTLPGNSGAGGWDASGRLACIVTHARGNVLGGHCSSLAGRSIAD